MGFIRQSPRINVVYRNGVKDRVSPALLGTLINGKQIEQFERSSGWVNVATDAVRQVGESSFAGTERRRC